MFNNGKKHGQGTWTNKNGDTYKGEFKYDAFNGEGVFAFADVPQSHINAQAINYLQENKVIQGYEDGTFKPSKKVNRVEFLKIVLEGSGKKLDVARFHTGLEEFVSKGGEASFKGQVERPILMISRGIQTRALTAMKVLKIRGYCQLLALDISTLKENDIESKFQAQLNAEVIPSGDKYLLLKPVMKIS